MSKYNEAFNKIQGDDELKERIISKGLISDRATVKSKNKGKTNKISFGARSRSFWKNFTAAALVLVMIISVMFLPWANNNQPPKFPETGNNQGGEGNNGDNNGNGGGYINKGSTVSGSSNIAGILSPIAVSRNEIIELFDINDDGDWKDDDGDKSTDDESSSVGDDDDFAKTNVQEEGVDEGDIIKVDNNFIYTLSCSGLLIVNISDTMTVSYYQPFEDFFPDEMFIFGNKLVVIGGIYNYLQYDYCNDSEPVPYWGGRSYTQILVYNLNDRVNVKLLDKYSISGNFITSRLIDNKLTVAISHSVSSIDTLFPKINGDEIDLGDVYIYKSGKYHSYAIMASIDLNTLELNISAHLGIIDGWYNSSTIYFSKENVYFFCEKYESKWKSDTDSEWTYNSWYTSEYWYSTYIVKISLGSLKYGGSQIIDGRVGDRYWASEYDNYLRVVSHYYNYKYEFKYQNGWENITKYSNVYVLSSNMEIIGSLSGIAKNENIHAVRFSGDKGTISTFLEIDPLFTIDFSCIENLSVTSGPRDVGTNNYLQYLTPDLLLGLGINSVTENNYTYLRGMKVSLYDSSSGSAANINTTELGRVNAYSEALYNPKAILNDPARNMFSFPIRMWENLGYGGFMIEGQGLAVFSYDINASNDRNKLVYRGLLSNLPKDKVYHNTDAGWYEYYKDYFSFIKRGARIGNKIYTISDRFITSYDITTLQMVQQIEAGVDFCHFMHKWGDWVNTPTTCTQDSEQYRVCKLNPEHIQRYEWEAPGHNMSEWKITAIPSEVSQGAETRYCTRHWSCNYFETRELVGHAGVNGVVLALNDDCTEYRVRTFMGSSQNAVIPASHNGIPVTSIGEYAFQDLSVRSVTIPSSVKRIEQYAFDNAAQLSIVTFDKGSELEVIGMNAFSYSAIQSITIPNGVTKIESNAFEHTQRLNSVLFEKDSQLKIIGSRSFIYSSLTSINIPKSVTKIESGVFQGSKGYQYYLSPLNNISFEEGSQLESIGSNAFYFTSIKSVIIPKSIKTIAASAFESNGQLSSVSLDKDSSLVTIGSSAFSGCPIKTINIPKTVTSIEWGAFRSCGSLENVNFDKDSQLGIIGSEAFYGCVNLRSIALPDSLGIINDSAFRGTRLTAITLPQSLGHIGGYAFSGTLLKDVYIPASVTFIANAVFSNISCLESLTVDSANPVYKSDGNNIIHSATNVIIQGSNNSIIPDYITNIGANAFEGSGIKNITVPNSVSVISSSAFQGSALETIAITKYVEHINSYAFANCYNLISVIIPDDSNLLSIGSYAFSNATRINSLNIPASVVSVGTWAFNGWTTLQTINIFGAEDQYAATTKFGANWRAGSNAVLKYF